MMSAAPRAPQPTINCHYHGCRNPATCLPRVYVPCSMLSHNLDAEDVSSLVGLPLCDPCFKKLTAKELLDGERGRPIRDGVVAIFRQRNAFPNFDKAVIGRISRFDTDWQVFLRGRELQRRKN